MSDLPASTTAAFHLWTGDREEVGGGEGHWGGRNNEKKKKKKEKDLCQQMKEPSFSCVSGEIK